MKKDLREMKKSVILILFAVLAMMTVSILSVSAQDIDVDSMDNEQLTVLLMQILGKLQQDETPAAGTDPEIAETPTSTPEPVPAADPEAIVEIFQIAIYDNKKLIIEALPSYMFIQPTEAPKPEKPAPNGGKDTEPAPEATPVCPYPRTWGCDINGNCWCGLG